VKKLLLMAVTAVVLVLGTAIPASAQYNPMYLTVSPNQVEHCSTSPGTITVAAGYFEAGSTVTVTMQSDPVTLGTAVADAAGNISGTFILPAATTEGTHTVFATGTRLGTGVSETVSSQFTVVFPAGCVQTTQVTQTTPSSGNLPVTGSDNGMFIAVGACLLVAGGLLVMATRKRNAARA
jgi:LPXTG-motif cell wall-anchored protein